MTCNRRALRRAAAVRPPRSRVGRAMRRYRAPGPPARSATGTPRRPTPSAAVPRGADRPRSRHGRAAAPPSSFPRRARTALDASSDVRGTRLLADSPAHTARPREERGEGDALEDFEIAHDVTTASRRKSPASACRRYGTASRRTSSPPDCWRWDRRTSARRGRT